MKRTILLAMLLFCASVLTARAAPPCDFKGLSVGDKATPQQIMQHFGIENFKPVSEKETQAQRDAAFEARMKRAAIVGITNAAEEEAWNRGPSCDYNYCRIPYGEGVSVGSGSLPTNVGVFVSFNKSGLIDEIDVSFDWLNWDDILELINNKYGDNWRVEYDAMPITNYETKTTTTVTRTTLTHRTLGQNTKTGDKCALRLTSHDIIFEHSTPPLYQSVFMVKLISKNF